MRRVALLIGLLGGGQAGVAQTIVTSPSPTSVAVTIYRDPDRGVRTFNLRWLGGYALVSETRQVSLPAGESELRFEGVTGGIVPQSAIVTGLGEAVLEKNRDARLLSPGALLDASLGERLTLRRTSVATGAMREQEAIVRATANGVVVQTADGIEALDCTGLSQTLLANRVPAGLSAKPTLSVRVRSPQPIERDVTLTYITNNFDWQADYVADLTPDGSRLSLFGWLTLANGDATGLAGAATQAVAGKLNRERVWVEPGRAWSVPLQCWPSGTTSDIPDKPTNPNLQEIVVTGRRLMEADAPLPPPPPPPMAAPVASKVMASEERLGDVRLYRIPIAVTVASHSQKQIAFLDQPTVRIESILRLRPVAAPFDSPLERVLRTYNDKASGLGLALPAGKLEIFRSEGGRRLLVGEGQMDDRTVGEKVEIVVGASTGIHARQTAIPEKGHPSFQLTISNDTPGSEVVEIEFPLHANAVRGGKLASRDGWKLWRVQVPANGSRTLVYNP